jgi:two-component system response regulator RegA
VNGRHARRDRALDVVVVDESDEFLTSIERGLKALGCSVWTARTFDEACHVVQSHLPSYVVSEMRVAGRHLADFIDDVRETVPVEQFVVATAYPSVAVAVKMTKWGVAGYLAKPTSAQAIVDTLAGAVDEVEAPEPTAAPTSQWPSLDRTIWEYLNQVHVLSGSMSEAARRLHLDRRSLRRMLAKYPPCR